MSIKIFFDNINSNKLILYFRLYNTVISRSLVLAKQGCGFFILKRLGIIFSNKCRLIVLIYAKICILNCRGDTPVYYKDVFCKDRQLSINKDDSIYNGKIESIDKDGMVILPKNISNGFILEQVNTDFLGNIIIGSDLYTFSLKFLRYTEVEKHIAWLFSLPDNIKRIQRRKHYRVDVNLPAEIFLYDEKSFRYIFDDKILGMIQNLSLGGIGLVTKNKKIINSKELCIKFKLDNVEIIEHVEIRFLETKIINNEQMIFLGLKFTSLDYRSQSTISCFVNKKVLLNSKRSFSWLKK